jgi:hypothetical protein
MPESTGNYPKSILKKHPSPIKETQDKSIQQDAPIQKAKYGDRNVYIYNQLTERINTPNSVHSSDKSDNHHQSIYERTVNISPLTDNNSNINIPTKTDTEGKKTSFSKFFSFLSKFWNPDNINLSNPNTINKKTTTILKSYKNHQYKYLMLLSVVCPIFTPVLVARATVDLGKKIKLAPMEHQKNIEDPIVDKFMHDLTKAVNNDDTTGIAQATVDYLSEAADPNLLGEFQDKYGLQMELQAELNSFVKQIQVMGLSIDKEEPPNDENTHNTRQPLDIFLASLRDNMKYIPLDQLESTKTALIGLEQTLEEHAKKLSQTKLAEFKEHSYMISNIQEEIDVTINTTKAKESNSERGKKLKLLLEEKKRERKKKIDSKIASGRITLSHRPNKQRKQYTKLMKKGVEIKDDNIEKLYEKQNRPDDDVVR